MLGGGWGRGVGGQGGGAGGEQVFGDEGVGERRIAEVLDHCLTRLGDAGEVGARVPVQESLVEGFEARACVDIDRGAEGLFEQVEVTQGARACGHACAFSLVLCDANRAAGRGWPRRVLRGRGVF